MRKTTRRLAVGATAVTVAVASGVAWASWTADGRGTAGARAGRAVQVVITGATVASVLVPGGEGDVAMNVENPNPFRVRVIRVHRNGDITADAAHPGCLTTGVVFPNHPVSAFFPNAALAGLEVAPNSTARLVLSNQARMTNDSDNGCQRATFTIPVVAEVEAVNS
jgi:hypothetical protein